MPTIMGRERTDDFAASEMEATVTQNASETLPGTVNRFPTPLLGPRHPREIDRQANAPAGRRDLRPRTSQLPGSAPTWQRCEKKVRDDPQRAATALLRGISMAASDASEDGQADTSGENGSAAASAAAYHHRKEVPHSNPKRQRDRPR
jgi:hypothetical protein